MKTKQAITVGQVYGCTPSQEFINAITQMGIDDGQSEIMFEFTNQFGKLTILNLDVDTGGDDDN